METSPLHHLSWGHGGGAWSCGPDVTPVRCEGGRGPREPRHAERGRECDRPACVRRGDDVYERCEGAEGLIAFDVYLSRVNRMWREAERMRAWGHADRPGDHRHGHARADACERRERPGDRERVRDGGCVSAGERTRACDASGAAKAREAVRVVVLLVSGRVRGGLIDVTG